MQQKQKDFIGYMMPILNEKQRRFFLAKYSECIGYGSASEISDLTGVSQRTISSAKKEFSDAVCDPESRPSVSSEGRIRAPGGGRKSSVETYPGLEGFMTCLLEHKQLGIPTDTLKWTTLSAMDISDAAKMVGMPVSDVTVLKILRQMGFSTQRNRKYIEKGSRNPARGFQFTYIAMLSSRFVRDGQPVISVDTKKKELVGNYANNGSEYRPTGCPRLVNGHDFEGEGGKVAPYGIFDIEANEGFVNVGISSDTAEFAVNSIMQWWTSMGCQRYPDAKRIMITADGGGSNGSRNRLWKRELQRFADETGLEVFVSHLPPGTSKWNKIEHRMFAFISKNWRGRPLEDMATIVSLIGATTTKTGLKVSCSPDYRIYEKGIKVTDEEMAEVNLIRTRYLGEWNYMIGPRGPAIRGGLDQGVMANS